MLRLRSIPILGVIAIAACAEPPVTPVPAITGARGGIASIAAGQSYVLLADSAGFPADLVARVEAAGGSITANLDDIGVAMATSDDPDFATQAGEIDGIQIAARDTLLQFEDPNLRVVETDVGEATHEVGGHETFRAIQWAPDAISAPAAWATGARGAGARVAILDGGVHSTHIDIAPNLDVARSASFVPGQAFNADVGTFWHGTHVAGIVGAPANNIGTVGIAPEATLIGVKVLHNGSGAFAWVINGIYYAATPIAEGGAGAHIINMSLGAGFLKNPNGDALMEALNRATNYAYKRGVTVIAAAGNDGVNIDPIEDLVFVPAMNVNVIAVSATGPMGFAQGATNFDRPASYTNHGQRAIQLAGPGGDFALPGNDVCVMPRFPTGTVVQLCWVMDMVIAPSRGAATSISSYSWAAGTSMASPAVAGVAALIVGKFGPMHPAQVGARLRQSADDLGKKGNDDFYGRGRVNALGAVSGK